MIGLKRSLFHRSLYWSTGPAAKDRPTVQVKTTAAVLHKLGDLPESPITACRLLCIKSISNMAS
jgi:hypothetical protein